MFQRPFSFEGRIRRTEYGITFIIYLVAYFLILAIMSSGDVAAISAILFIPLVWFLWAQGAKRCHDVGSSGWMQIVPFYVLYLLFKDGDPGNNEYGSNPKNPGGGDVPAESETLDGHFKN